MCYLWGGGLIASRTPGAVQAPSSVGGGPARHAPSPPRPAPLRKQALTATRYTGRSRPWPRWLGIGGGLRRQARPPPGPVRRGMAGPRPSQPLRVVVSERSAAAVIGLSKLSS